jgi:hypothetical protein
VGLTLATQYLGAGLFRVMGCHRDYVGSTVGLPHSADHFLHRKKSAVTGQEGQF